MATDKTKFWSRWVTAGTVLSILGFLGVFLFNKVTAMPETYYPKADAVRVHTELKESIKDARDDFNTRQEQIQEKLDKSVDKIVDKIDGIQIYLRDRPRNPDSE
jgi:hypothetical protein